MSSAFLWILGSVTVVSLISLVGVFALGMKENTLRKIILMLVGFSAGALIGGAFLHLLPEALASMEIMTASVIFLSGFSFFFLVERLLHWHHCHEKKCTVHMLSYMSLTGDSVHNFIDGLAIATSYLSGTSLGIATTFAVIAHEIPQELGDFGVLVYGGITKSKALLYNFLSALAAVAGALFGYFLSGFVGQAMPFILPFAAGGFVYVGASDLVPELHKEAKLGKSLISFGFFLAGMGFMLLITLPFGG